MSLVERRFSKLYLALGHSFSSPDLLKEALTHPSASAGEGKGKQNFERLEFLGDRVLGLVIAKLMTQRFPDERVGTLARRYTALVRTETLTRVALRLDLGSYIIMSRGEDDAGGRQNPAILADCCEAVIGALYLDGGLEAAERFIHARWLPLLDEVVRAPKDPKTSLQEWVQARGLPLPVYSTVTTTGPDHDPTFSVQVSVRGFPRVTASGRSKRQAEQSAAAFLLRLIRGKQQKKRRTND